MRGGKRPGAGRKRLGDKTRVGLTVMIDRQTLANIESYCKENGCSRGVAIDHKFR